MADLLPEFEQQFATITADITANISQISSKDGAERRTLVQGIERLVEDAKEVLERMDMEVRELEPAQRERLGGRVKSYQVELKRLEGEYLRVKSTSQPNEAAMRAELMEGGMAGLSNGEEQRQSLLDNTEILERTSTRLTQGHKIALETEHIGAQILNDLHSQRQTLGRARERLHETDSELDQSSRVLNTMLRRVLQNRFILMAVFVVLFIVIIVSIYVAATKD